MIQWEAKGLEKERETDQKAKLRVPSRRHMILQEDGPGFQSGTKEFRGHNSVLTIGKKLCKFT